MAHSNRFYLGIDPGLSGGIAVLCEDGSLCDKWKMPQTPIDVYEVFQSVALLGPVRAMLERVSASPQMGVVSAFTFGAGYGALQMALAATKIPYDLVTPVKWQTALGCRTQGDKNVSKRRAQQLFPSIQITHAVADALLLAEYARRVDRGAAS